MAEGKKYVVISQEEYEMLKNKTHDTKLANPVKQDLHRSEREMKSIWDTNLQADEKIRLFTEELNNLKSKYDSLTKPKPLEVVIAKSSIPQNMKSIEGNVIESLPKTNQTDGLLLLEHLKSRPDIIQWNSNGEIIFKGDLIPGSNLTDLISSVSTTRKSTIPILPQSVFLKALSEANVPETWIKNKGNRKLLQSYKSLKEQNPFHSPNTKKMKTNWISST